MVSQACKMNWNLSFIMFSAPCSHYLSSIESYCRKTKSWLHKEVVHLGCVRLPGVVVFSSTHVHLQ